MGGRSFAHDVREKSADKDSYLKGASTKVKDNSKTLGTDIFIRNKERRFKCLDVVRKGEVQVNEETVIENSSTSVHGKRTSMSVEVSPEEEHEGYDKVTTPPTLVEEDVVSLVVSTYMYCKGSF